MDAIRVRLRDVRNELVLVEVASRGPAPIANALKITLAPAGYEVVLSKTQALERELWELLYVRDVHQRPLTRQRIAEIVGCVLATLEPRLRLTACHLASKPKTRKSRRQLARPDYLTGA
jgi:hypothetical protein